MPLARGAVKTGMQRHARRLTGWRRTSGDGDTEERDTHEGKRFDRTPPFHGREGTASEPATAGCRPAIIVP